MAASPPRVAVIGSGLSGYFCAKALVERGAAVTMLDGGEDLPRDRKEIVESMRWAPKASWQPGDVARLTENPTVRTRPIPKKLVFGSDYIYGHGRSHTPVEGEIEEMAFTFAKGGFSNAWAGAILPISAVDMNDWPLTPSQLEPYYRRVLRQIPLSGRHDMLEAEFPLHRDSVESVPLGQAAVRMLDGFERRSETLRKMGILAGQTRQAIAAGPWSTTPGCDGCGLCLSGCPRNAILCTTAEVDRLACEHSNFRYVANALVTRLRETASEVELTILDPRDGTSRGETYDHVFVATGPIWAARLILDALDLYDRPLVLRESQKYLLPFLRPDPDPQPFTGGGFCFPNAVLLVGPRGATAHWSQVQLSPVSDLVFQKLRFDPGKAGPTMLWLARQGLGRLVFGWGSIHSDLSAHLTVTLRPGRDERPPVVAVAVRENPLFASAFRDILWRLTKAFPALGLFPLGFLARLAKPGSGNHYGGLFPMRESPKEPWETDLLARPGKLRRVYLPDTTSLPNVPGTTVGLLLMANATRIGAEAALD